MAAISEESAVQGDLIQGAAWRTVRSLVLVAEGQAETAERVAREAVELVAGSDAPSSRAEARMALAGVLMAQGKNDEALGQVRDAKGNYEAKGNVLGVARARELLELVV